MGNSASRSSTSSVVSATSAPLLIQRIDNMPTHIEERPTKRPKTDESSEEFAKEPVCTHVSRDAAVADGTGTATGIENIELPAELWAHCCHYLSYSDVKNVATTSSTMLHDVMPAIARIHIFHANELQSSHASRMPRVERVYLYCLLQGQPETRGRHPMNAWSLEYSMETQYRIVPFLCCFPKLEFVFLGAMAYWQDRSRQVWNGISPLHIPVEATRVAQADRGSQGHRTLVQAFCGAFATRCLKDDFIVEGLFHAPSVKLCPFGVPLWLPSAPRRRRQCPACNHVLRHFPSDWLIRARGNFLCATAIERFQQVMTRDGDAKLLKDVNVVKRLLEDGFREKSVSQNARYHNICLVNATLQDLKALVELKLLDPKTFDNRIFYNCLRKIKKEKANPIRFSERDWKALIAMGFVLEQSILVNDMGIPLYTAPNGRGRDVEDFLQERRERMQERQDRGGEGGGGIDDGFLNFLRNVGADVHVHPIPPGPFGPRPRYPPRPPADPAGGDANQGGGNVDAPPNPIPGMNFQGPGHALPPWFRGAFPMPPHPLNGGDEADHGMNGANGGIEVNIVEGGDMGPVFANIFDRVQDVVREQLGDEQAQQFGDLHDAVLGGGEEADNDQQQGMGGIIMGGVIGMPPHLAMGFGGGPPGVGVGGLPPMFARMPDGAARAARLRRPPQEQPPRRDDRNAGANP